MKNPDIINQPSFAAQTDCTIYKGRTNNLFPCIKLKDWHYKITPQYKLTISGYNGERNICTSQVVQVKNGIVHTINTPYKLEGGMSAECMPYPEFDKNLFASGFCENFNEIIKREIKRIEDLKIIEKAKNNSIKKNIMEIKFNNKESIDPITNQLSKNKKITNYEKNNQLEEVKICQSEGEKTCQLEEEKSNQSEEENVAGCTFDPNENQEPNEVNLLSSLFKHTPLIDIIDPKNKEAKEEGIRNEIPSEKEVESGNSTPGYHEEESASLSIEETKEQKSKCSIDFINLGSVRSENKIINNDFKKSETLTEESKGRKTVSDFLLKGKIKLANKTQEKEAIYEFSNEKVLSQENKEIKNQNEELCERNVLTEKEEILFPEETSKELISDINCDNDLKKEKINNEIKELSEEMLSEKNKFKEFFDEIKEAKNINAESYLSELKHTVKKIKKETLENKSLKKKKRKRLTMNHK